jgi:hypothetical protein
MVAEEFVRRRIAPLQAHKKPMWAYSGLMDPMRLHPCDHRPAVVATIMGGLFVNPDVPAAVPVAIRPLYQVPDQRQATLAQMPTFTALGLAGEEEEEEGPMPVAKDGDAAESPYASEAEHGDAEQGDAEAEAVPSAGGASSSQAAPPTAEVYELSSSDGEEAEAGRQEPRTKAAHDRPAGEPPSASLKRKAEAAPEGSGGRTAPSWRASGMAWVDTRAKKSK